MNVNDYLERINYKGSLIPSYKSVCELQLSHLLTVPFENLSIHNKEPIILDYELLYTKIVTRRRGGFCYELNGLFALLLKQLGYKVTILSAEVAQEDDNFGPSFDHMTLMISLENNWLVDVGFGDSFREPLLIEKRDAQFQGKVAYQITESENYLILSEKKDDCDWKLQYRFTLRPYELEDFIEMCNYHQTSPQSHFTQKRVCSIAKPNGRITISDMRLIETIGNERSERRINDDLMYNTILEKEFGIILKPIFI